MGSLNKRKVKLLSLDEKMVNFPSVNYINMDISPDRKKFMEEQSIKYKFKATRNKTLNLVQDSSSVKYLSRVHPDNVISKIDIFVAICHLQSMKKWFEETDEEYAIFCDDDTDFSSINYWNFTWQEFIDKLPDDWEAVHLIRMRKLKALPASWKLDMDSDIKLLLDGRYDTRQGKLNRIQLSVHYPIFGGGCYLFKRDYVEKFLNDVIVSENEYNFICENPNSDPCIGGVENTMMSKGKSYNFPLFYENVDITSTTGYIAPDFVYLNNNIFYYTHVCTTEYYEYFWKTYGNQINLDKMMELSTIKE